MLTPQRGTMHLRLEKNDRFAIPSIFDEKKSAIDMTGYYTLYHVFERTEKSALIFQCKLMDILANVKEEGNRRLDAEYEKRPYDLSWYLVTRCADGSYCLSRGVENIKLEFGIQFSPIHLKNIHCSSPLSNDDDISSPCTIISTPKDPPSQK